MAEPPPFVCPICKRVSCHPRDAEMRFCAKCGFVDDVLAEWKVRAITFAEEIGGSETESVIPPKAPK